MVVLLIVSLRSGTLACRGGFRSCEALGALRVLIGREAPWCALASINARSALGDDASASSIRNWGFGGVLSPPMGSWGKAPGKFFDFAVPERQEKAFLGHAEKELTDNWWGVFNMMLIHNNVNLRSGKHEKGKTCREKSRICKISSISSFFVKFTKK